MIRTNNKILWFISFELLGNAKALLPIRRRNSETSREMDYAEIKAYRDIGAKVY